MQFDDFLGQVQSRGRMSSSDDALRAVRATFTTLNERLAGQEPANLGAQLPNELAQYLGEDGHGERFDSNEFLNRVSEREHVDLPKSIYHVRAVMEVLSAAASPGEMDHVRAQLPNDYQRLFDSGSAGPMASA